MKNRVLSGEMNDKLGSQVTVAGWVNSRRDHGGLIFIDLRDHQGIIQLVVTPDTPQPFQLAESLRDEYVITATGTLRQRSPELKNPNIPTGDIEIVVEKLTLLNKSAPLPVNTHDDGEKSSEEQRLKYRYLDLRRPSMQAMLRRRAEFYQYIRRYMEQNDFVEIATPILANSSPEGARDFLVPSRLHPGEFYALPQAPQQFKQLLMVGGVPRYYQIAPCFRDEDPRADRLYGDFYQLDLEMAFVDDGAEVRRMIEPLMQSLVTDFAHKKLTFKDKIPTMTYQEAMETYGTDKPDLRYDMPLVDLTDVFKTTNFKVFQTECVKALCVKNGASLTRSQIDNFTEEARRLGAGGLAYIIYEKDAAKSPIAKFLTEEELAQIKTLTQAEPGDAVFFGAADRAQVNKVLGALRIAFAQHFELTNSQEVAYCWVTDFPFYEYNEGEQKIDFGHNPFSMPTGGLAALEAAQTDAQKLAITADQFDLVMNGLEVSSGAVRNYNPDIMYKAFAMLGYDKQYVDTRFGGLLNAFKFGAPPHAGCAPGLDRIFMELTDATNIRDCLAFPKNGSGVDLMMGSPASVDEKLLADVHVAVLPGDEELAG